ncbi:MAG: hypothetical protein COT37_01475 [Parcubacteria group bacterium CG08_land_8_20_14_0_20_43_9]|nr:MAG: hypothetical protein COT37_01475 [Parcubacteria group bacterium CG08_land_8_20_14_0_20_43_9]
MFDDNFRQFLKEQIALPKEKWDKVFVDYIQKKFQEPADEARELSPEQEMEVGFQRYLRCLDIEKENLAGKRILDLGCGEGLFVKHCLGQGISGEVYGLDILIEPEKINLGYRQFFLKGDFEEKIPLDDFDYIFSVAAIDAIPSEGDQRKLRRALLSALIALKHDGEIRIFPVRKAPSASGLAGIDSSRRQWIKLLDELKAKEWIDYELRPIDITVVGKDQPEGWLDEALIIKKKLVEINL